MSSIPEGFVPVQAFPSATQSSGDLPEGFEPTMSAQVPAGFQAVSPETGQQLTPQNYGRVAAVRINKARQERQTSTGQDLNQNEQAAIMDTYRRIAGLEPLSMVDTFAESQQHIAKHQSDLLNLARSTSSAFERQAVNFVAPAIDAISPGWGTQTRKNIAAMNPFDEDRVSGKAGSTVAALPLLLAGGGTGQAAAVFGLNSLTDSLANSEDTGITGYRKWVGAGGQAALTAGSVMLGGKLGEWATKSLASKIPAIQKLLLLGDHATATQIIAKEATAAGINLPIQGSAMIAGAIGDNLLAQQTTDPTRKWNDGLTETALNVAAMTLTNHVVQAGQALAAPAPEDYPAGRPPVIVTGEHVPDVAGTGDHPEKVYVSKSVPSVIDVEGTPVDAHATLGLHETIERDLEENHGLPDDTAHALATAGEHNAIRRMGLEPEKYEKALEPHEAAAAKDDLSQAPADLDKTPYNKPPPVIPRDPSIVTQERDIEQYPDGRSTAIPHSTYDIADRMTPARAAEVPGNLNEFKGENAWIRPAGTTSNSDRQLLVQFSTHLINDGRPRTAADDYYDKLYESRPGYARPTDFWELPQWIGVAAKNLPNSDVYVVRNLDEARKFLGEAKYGTIAMSALDVNTKLAQGLIDGYGGKVAVGGYTDMAPFKGGVAGPEYGVHSTPDAAKFVPGDRSLEVTKAGKSRFFRGQEGVVVRRLDGKPIEGEQFAGALDPGTYEVVSRNQADVRSVEEGHAPGRSNVSVYTTMPDWIKAEGHEFREGTDYRHFKGTEVIPRLSLSEGCLHNCDFCGVDGKGKAPREIDRATVDQQVASFGDLSHRLVYINDKTFGQAKNHQDLIDINNRIKEKNPDFQGFIIQTSAAQMKKMTPEFLKQAGVKYVELGVESYNDDILKSVKKPANTAMIDEAVQKVRDAGAKFIPNVMIGLPGETPETYGRTLKFLHDNADVISHVNAYNVALYSGSELSKKVGGVKAETDADENVTRKSWQQTPEVDQAFHDAVMKFGSEALDRPVEPPAPPPGTDLALAGQPEEPNGGLPQTMTEASLAPRQGYIPPRPPNEPPPPREIGGASPDEPEGRAGKAGVDAQLAAFTGDTRTTWDRLGDGVKATIDGLKRYSGKMFPTISRLGKSSGEKGATYISSKIWAVEKAAEMARTIVGGDGDLDLKLGALLTEDNLRSLAAKSIGMDQVFDPNNKQIMGALRPDQIEKLKGISTTIGSEGSPFQTEADYQAALKDPTMKAALDRVRKEYGPIIDDLFRKAQGLNADEELAKRGYHTGVRINLMGVDPNQADKAGMIVTGSKQGNLRNTMRGKTPFSKQATGTGDAYETRFSKIIENSLARTSDVSFKNDFARTLAAEGIAQIGPRGRQTSMGKYQARALPLSNSEDLYVRSDAYHEVRAAFNVDSPEYNTLLKGAANFFNKTALASVSEAAYHLGNQASALVRAPGTGLVLPKLIAKTWGLLTHDETTMRQVSELAKIGAWRSDIPESGDGGRLYKYTLGLMGRVVGKMDQAGRLTLDDAFRGLANKGVALNTEGNRRDFVNQLGQYNRRAQSRIIALARDTGLGPFATAGTNFYAQSIRSLALSPGMKATSGFNAARLRLMVAGRFATILGGVAVANYLRWGRVDGDDQTPIGAIKLENGADGKVRYFDVASLLNVTRGLRAIGVRAMLEGPRQGKTSTEVASDAAKDAATSALSPFMGPIMRFGAVATTGKGDFVGGFPVGPQIAKDENPVTAHLKAAVLSANPIISKLTGQTQSPVAGKFEVQSRQEKSVAMQIASREAAERVPSGQQTRAEMEQTKAEHGYRDSWAKNDQQPLLGALQRGDINIQRARELINESQMSDLARTVHHLTIETSLRVYDHGTPTEKKDLYPVMIQHLQNLIKTSPLKAAAKIEEYRKRGLIQ